QGRKEKVPDQEYILLPLMHTSSYVPSSSEEDESSLKDDAGKKNEVKDLAKESDMNSLGEATYANNKYANGNSIYRMFTPINAAGSSCDNLGGSILVNVATFPNTDLPTDPLMLEDTTNFLNTGIFSGAWYKTDITQKDEKHSQKRQNWARNGKV
ncbi:hypothetical protein Tco_0961902, partial [Tanacetum coccineum]